MAGMDMMVTMVLELDMDMEGMILVDMVATVMMDMDMLDLNIV